VAAEVGYPVMLKATSGGGGRGIRRCNGPEDLCRHFDRVVSEARKAFGTAEVFLEKAIVNPRHIEVQILADHHGQVVHLFERDCSIQRRHQKLLEIAPSPQLDDEVRQRIGTYAVRAAEAVGYTNAGTVEFLLDREGRVYFMEMNTRLQVEHTVTEQITGVDIVKTQIRIANDEPLPFRQEDIARRGYAMQFRINAEDPQHDFLPSFGCVTRYYAPGGPGVRTDGAIYTGYEIPPHYDSLCVKLTVWALTWEEVLERSRRALKDIGVSGVKTTIPFHQRILQIPEFRAGHFDTSFIETHPELLDYSVQRPAQEVASAFAAAIAAHLGY
jgi:pyruvate carboxylase subunit A